MGKIRRRTTASSSSIPARKRDGKVIEEIGKNHPKEEPLSSKVTSGTVRSLGA